MQKRRDKLTPFDRLRRASALRVLLVVATMLASQNSLACAFEVALGAQGTEVLANEVVDASVEGTGDDCCTLCFDCAQCGGCHSSAVNPRTSNAHFFQSIANAKFTVATAAPKLWTPPALLRPPISAA